MEYTDAEKYFVNYCVDQVDCGDEASDLRCPQIVVCESICDKEGDSRPCYQAYIKLTHGIELNEKEIEIINYFMKDDLWKKNKCVPYGTSVECPNKPECDKRTKPICADFLSKLGISTLDELVIFEKEIEKIILYNLSTIDWGVEEKLSLVGHQVSIPEINARVDILLKGETRNTLYVVELKSSRATREDVGQLGAYVSWYKENPPSKFDAVKGILLSTDFDEGAKYAMKISSDLIARIFKLDIEVQPFN